MKKFLSDHWPAIASALSFVLPFLIPSLAAYASQHEHTVMGILCAGIIAAYYKYSPRQKNGGTPPDAPGGKP